MADHPTLYALLYDPLDDKIIKLRNDLGQEFMITKEFLPDVASMLAEDSEDAESAEATAEVWVSRSEELYEREEKAREAERLESEA